VTFGTWEGKLSITKPPSILHRPPGHGTPYGRATPMTPAGRAPTAVTVYTVFILREIGKQETKRSRAALEMNETGNWNK